MSKRDTSIRAKVEAARAPRRRRRADAIVAQYIHEISGRHGAGGARVATGEAR